ncbi:MAG: hypothetical protein A3B23_01340 [Candidatus Colwellbacteria bacterium RIFCSPLOWO2_01_FULL_48_10]|uniref:Uncharacterized protein n=1 Tax=Candidatus Colwellbacteria bacterium RIFCSPLOWO2_01_FULL_48_10 TaxID=1797690 RepID=A0A1G1Z559_9BACT|nr:MAG: hypothetical protein A3B23_01340 [Candidatus Colwellbacteria bacterium RIFCSPLOWO2_01_FULL_48_10]
MRLDITSDINRGYEAALNYPRTDKLVVFIHWFSFAVVAILAFTNSVFKIAINYPSPFSWRVISFQEALWTLIIGLFAALLPTLLVGKFSNHYYWRLFISFTLSVFAYLAVFISGGSIEMHFMFFGMIALVAIYADWRLGWFMFVLVGLHHGILNYLAPTWVYFYGRNDFSIFAHAFPVIIEVIFTTILCVIHRTTTEQVQQIRADFQEINKQIELEKKHNH